MTLEISAAPHDLYARGIIVGVLMGIVLAAIVSVFAWSVLHWRDRAAAKWVDPEVTRALRSRMGHRAAGSGGAE